MKHIIRLSALLLSLAMLLGMSVSSVSAAVADVTGTAKTETQSIKLGDVDTKVTLTQSLLSKGGKYSLGSDVLLNHIEVNLSDRVSMVVLNGGSYNWSKATMGETAAAYNKSHADGTVLAAVNGDPWLVYHTDYDGDGVAATGPSVKHGSVSRGIMIISGELWASHQIDDENNLARTDNAERGTPAAQGPVFAIKADGTAMIGTPRIAVKLENTTTGTNQAAKGINRLPAPNSIILYNQRCGTESFAMEDAYEIYLECENSAFRLSKATTGQVTAIFESGDTAERPAITEKTVIISARGSSINTIKDKYKIGDSVSVTCSVSYDASVSSQKADWAGVTQAIGGFFYLLDRGTTKGQPGNATNYPCSIIGMDKNGKVMMTTTTATVDGTRQACQMQNLPALCRELGYHTAILFDGGGSTTMVSLSGDKYVRRSAAVDGNNSVRSVISGIGVLYKGIYEWPTNAETAGTATYASLGIEQPELPDLEGADLRGAPTSSYRYYAEVQTINGDKQEGLIGLRNAESKTLVPATVSGIAVDENNRITLSGHAFVNGGQGEHYWSVDKDHWYRVTDATYSDSDDATKQIAVDSAAAMTSAHVTNAVFEGVSADLSAYAGQTVTVYFGISPSGAADKVCHYLTVENVEVPVPAPEMWDVNKNVVLHQSFDELRKNGDSADGVFAAGQSSSWNKVAGIDTNTSTLAYWGWVALNAEVGQFGYKIGDGEPVYDDSFAVEAEEGVVNAVAGVNGATTASRMLINIDVSSIMGTSKVQALYKSPDGTEVILCEFEVNREEAPETDPVTDPETDPVTDPVTDPETDPVTDPVIESGDASETEAPAAGGCASVIAGGTVLVCAAVVAGVVVLKKRED